MLILIKKEYGSINDMWLYHTDNGIAYKLVHNNDNRHFEYNKGTIKEIYNGKVVDRYKFDGFFVRREYNENNYNKYKLEKKILKKVYNDDLLDQWVFNVTPQKTILKKVFGPKIEYQANAPVPLLIMLAVADLIG